MNSIVEEINSLVKQAASGIDYLKKNDPEAYYLARNATRKSIESRPPSARQQYRNFVNLSQNRQAVPTQRRPVRYIQSRSEGVAPRDRVPKSQIRPNALRWTSDGIPYFERDGVPEFSKDFNVVRPAYSADGAKSAPSDAMMARFAPKRYDTRSGSLQGTPQAQQPAFDFRAEARKILKPHVSLLTDNPQMYNSFNAQWKDIKANPSKYSYAQQRRILNDWQNRIAMAQSRRNARV